MMVRLYKRDLLRLHPGQMLWYVNNHDKSRTPCKFIEVRTHKASKARIPPKNIAIKIYNNPRYIPSYVYVISPQYMGSHEYSQYFAKVTKREEPEFILRLLL